ncbi:MAG: Maf family protein [Peptostreptococcaceae bacterium]|nr:Maf family protein [Peptostreptococcaceae bacterium]MDY5739201.1 Maf family protein [Anaerovoracaceae bacterium]
MKPIFILASSSPRRIEIMEKHNMNPIVIPSNVDETLEASMDNHEAVEFLAKKKGLHVVNLLSSDNPPVSLPCDTFPVVLAADTVVYKGEILGKPEDRNDAFRMLAKIRGTDHYVTTGVAIFCPHKAIEDVFSVDTKVTCENYTDEDIEKYLDTDEPYDKAGAYAIQGLFKKHITAFDGFFDNVVGFPWTPIEEHLQKHGLI